MGIKWIRYETRWLATPRLKITEKKIEGKKGRGLFGKVIEVAGPGNYIILLLYYTILLNCFKRFITLKIVNKLFIHVENCTM